MSKRKMKHETKVKLIKTAVVIAVLLAIILAIYLPLQLTGTIDKIKSPENLKEFILSGGTLSYLIFFVLQFLQVTFLPLPAMVTTVAGTLVFGPLITSIISFFAVVLGSLFAFFLGKKIGRKIIVWIAGEEETCKWEQKLRQGNFAFFLMMLFPLFPDDILCLVAGSIGMSFNFFLITNILTRPPAIFMTAYLGSGSLIPFNGWGIPVWIALFIVVCVVLFLSFKYQPKIENFVMELANKMGIKKRKIKIKSFYYQNSLKLSTKKKYAVKSKAQICFKKKFIRKTKE